MMFAIKCIENLYIFNTMLYLLFVENNNACLFKVLLIINLCLIKHKQQTANSWREFINSYGRMLQTNLINIGKDI